MRPAASVVPVFTVLITSPTTLVNLCCGSARQRYAPGNGKLYCAGCGSEEPPTGAPRAPEPLVSLADFVPESAKPIGKCRRKNDKKDSVRFPVPAKWFTSPISRVNHGFLVEEKTGLDDVSACGRTDLSVCRGEVPAANRDCPVCVSIVTGKSL